MCYSILEVCKSVTQGVGRAENLQTLAEGCSATSRLLPQCNPCLGTKGRFSPCQGCLPWGQTGTVLLTAHAACMWRTGLSVFIPINEFFKAFCQLLDAQSGAILTATGCREDTVGWFSGLMSLMALGIWALPDVSFVMLSSCKVWNWCYNKCSGLGKYFEVRPERRNNALFPRLSLSHRCL